MPESTQPQTSIGEDLIRLVVALLGDFEGFLSIAELVDPEIDLQPEDFDRIARLRTIASNCQDLLDQVSRLRESAAPPTDAALEAISRSAFQLVEALPALAHGDWFRSLPRRLSDPGFWANFVLLFLSRLCVSFLQWQFPTTTLVLRLLGLVRTASNSHVEFFYPDAIVNLARPDEVFRTRYQWNEASNFLWTSFANDVATLSSLFGFQCVMSAPAAQVAGTPDRLQDLDIALVSSDDQWSDAIVLRVSPIASERNRLVACGFSLSIHVQNSIPSADPSGLIQISIDESVPVPTIEVRPSGVRLIALSSTPASRSGGSLAFRLLVGRLWSSENVLIGRRAGNFLEFEDPSLSLRYFTIAPRVALSLSSPKITIRLSANSFDGFLRSILSAVEFSADAHDVAVVLDSTTGLHLSGSASLRTALAVRRSIGPVIVDEIVASVQSHDSAVSFSAALATQVIIGPLRAAVRHLGVRFCLFPQATTTRDGPGAMNVAAEFAAPESIGLALSAPGVTGGGALLIDTTTGRYSGSLSFVAGPAGLSAIGLLETRLGAERPPFSLAALLFLRLPPIPLGLGFFLTGVGGLVGIHRTVDIATLRAMVRSGSLNQLLFPRDPARNTAELLERVTNVFPNRSDRHFFGPAISIDYGSAGRTLVSIKAALIVELPAPLVIALCGSASSSLPTASEAIVELNVQMLGVVDIGQQLVSIDASLNDSRIGPFSLYGDLAFRLGWGEQPYFLLSIGGFNPHFQAPSNFPTLRRLTLGYTAPNGLVRLRIESYFAITSNTLQLGARIEVQVRVEIASIDGMLAFDALVIFSPFSFRIDFLASLSVTVFGAKLLAIHLEGTIKGPKPWHVTGKARLSVLFIEAAVDVDVKFGGEPSLEELPAVDPTDRLLEALRAPGSWKGELMPGVSRPVSLSDASNSETPLFDPVGVPAVRQTIVPLNRKLDRFAEGRIGGPGRYDVRAARVGTAPATQRPAHELFAAAQFEQMSDAEKLSRPSFEKMDAGALLASDAISVGPKSQGAGLFEQVKLGADETPTTATLPSEQILASSRSGASSLRGLRVQGSDRFAPPPGSAPRIALADELYVAVRRDSLRPSERSVPETAGAASALVQWLTEESGGASLFHVAPAFEATGGESR